MRRTGKGLSASSSTTKLGRERPGRRPRRRRDEERCHGSRHQCGQCAHAGRRTGSARS